MRPLPAQPAPTSTTELRTDLGVEPPAHGDLTAWADQGVMLLNRVLTVRPGEAASHRGRGWEEVTECAIHALAARGGPLAAILWGRDAQGLKPMLGAGAVGGVGAPLARSRRTAGSSAPGRSAGSTGCWSSRAGTSVDWRLPRLTTGLVRAATVGA